MGTRAHYSFKTTHSSPPSGIKMAPTIKFRAKNRGGQLVITVVSCEDLPDMDAAGIGFGNKSDPYVIVRVGGEEQKTKALSGKLNPEFNKDSSTFTFDVDGDVTSRRIYFKVMTRTPSPKTTKWPRRASSYCRPGQWRPALPGP